MLHDMPWEFRNSATLAAVKHVALSEIIFPGGPKLRIISSSIDFVATSAVAGGVATAIAHPVKCSTHISRKRFPALVVGRGPAKSIETLQISLLYVNAESCDTWVVESSFDILHTTSRTRRCPSVRLATSTFHE